MNKPTFVVTDSMVEIYGIYPPGIVLLKEQVLELFSQVTANQPDWLMDREEENAADSPRASSYLQAFRKEKVKKLEEDVQRLTVERDEYFAAYEAKHEALKQSEFERDMAFDAYAALRSALKDKG